MEISRIRIQNFRCFKDINIHLKNPKQGRPGRMAARSGTAQLDQLIAKATVDCYNGSEEVTGIFTMLEENLAAPFPTTLLGVKVTVERVDLNDADEIVAVCRRGCKKIPTAIDSMEMTDAQETHP
jgi:hypothetical protein